MVQGVSLPGTEALNWLGSEMADDDAKQSFAPPVKKRNELGLPRGLVCALKWIFVAIFLTSIVIGVVGIFL